MLRHSGILGAWRLSVIGVAFGFSCGGAVGNARGEAPTAEPVSAAAKLAAAAIHVPEGYAASAAASEPQLANPVAFCFDPAGRIFVAETFRVHKGVEDNRRHADWLDEDLAARTVEDRRAYFTKHLADRLAEYTHESDDVRMLEDRDGDGLYEASGVFSTGYNDLMDGAAAGVMWSGDRLLFTCIPSLWELRDADGDGQAEQKRSLLTGFGVHVALFGHDMHGLCQGPDGKIYFSIGDRGLNIETPGGPVTNIVSGSVLRCNPDGSDLELFATGLRNPQELAFNEVGDLFTVDNNSDSGDQARLVHIVEGMQAGWRMSYQYLPDRGPFNREKIWHLANDEQPASIVPPLAHITAGPSGLVRYPGTGMPAECDGSYFVCDFRGGPATSGVMQFWVEPDGATYKLKKDRMFAVGVLATDCDFGPDGGLYISDWVNGWVGTGTGRIHRVAAVDPAAKQAAQAAWQLVAAIPNKPVGELPSLLAHADMRVRLAAEVRLVAAGPDSAKIFTETAGNEAAPQVARLHAIWGLGQLAERDASLFDRLAALTHDKDAAVRGEAARALGRGKASPAELRDAWGMALVPLLADESPRVRLLAAISLGKLQTHEALGGLLALARDNADRVATLRHAAAMGLAGSQSAEALVAAAKDVSPAERLAIVVALGRQKSPLAASLLQDDADRVRLEAARVIWDVPIPEAYGALAAALGDGPSSEPLVRRALAASLTLGTPERLQQTIAFAMREQTSPELADLAWETVRQWASPPMRDPVHGGWRPTAPRTSEMVVATLRKELPQILAAGDRGAPAIVVAAESRLDEAYPHVAALLKKRTLPTPLAARGLDALAEAPESIVRQAIDDALLSDEPAVRIAARRLLARRFPDEAAERLAAVVKSGTLAEQQAAVATLADVDAPASRVAISALMALVEAGSCPSGLVLDVLDAAGRSSDAAVVQRVKAYQEHAAAGSPLAQYAVCLEGGDSAIGKLIFEQNATLSCRRCHSSNTSEQLVGPNLADVGSRRSRSEILESIVTPNAKIVEGFQTTTMLLDSGTTVSGILKSEDAGHAVLVNSDGKEIVVDLAEVTDKLQGQSPMPEGLAKQMTPRDLRNLVEYLSGLHAPPAVDPAAAASATPAKPPEAEGHSS